MRLVGMLCSCRSIPQQLSVCVGSPTQSENASEGGSFSEGLLYFIVF